MTRIGLLGCGSWGTTLAQILAKKGETVFYASKNKGAIKGVDKKRKNNVELDKKFI